MGKFKRNMFENFIALFLECGLLFRFTTYNKTILKAKRISTIEQKYITWYAK